MIADVEIAVERPTESLKEVKSAVESGTIKVDNFPVNKNVAVKSENAGELVVRVVVVVVVDVVVSALVPQYNISFIANTSLLRSTVL